MSERMTFDPTKPVQTRDGRAARIICTDRHVSNGDSIVALVDMKGWESVYIYRENGKYHDGGSDHPIDLINIPVKRRGWVNVYLYPGTGSECFIGRVHKSRERADEEALSDRRACVEIEWEVPA